MKTAISLNNSSIRLFHCHIYNHDYLWFSSFEISKVSTTLPVIHNYALSYSMGDFSYASYSGSTPNYEEDLKSMRLYCTPGYAEYFSMSKITYNAINDKTLRTDDAVKGLNTPKLGWRNYINPVVEDNNSKLSNGFKFYLFTYDGSLPKGVTRLGKKGCAMRITWYEIQNPLAIFKESQVRPGHTINPLDISGNVISYDPLIIPPHLLFRTAEICNDWFIFAGKDVVHLPGRVKEKCNI